MNKNYFLNLIRRKLQLGWRICLALMLITSIGIGSVSAQVNSYSFTQSNGSFTAIGGTVLGTATSNSGTASLYLTSFPVTLPFSFNFNGQNYTSLTASSNGYVTFGTGAATNSAPISSTITYDGAISAWGRAINAVFDINGKTGNMSWTVEGTAPNRVAVIQWENFKNSYSTSTTLAYVFSFQIRLEETTNKISNIYSIGSYLAGSTAVASTNAQIGLRGINNSDYNNRFNPSTVSFANSVSGTANSNGQSYNSLVDPPGMPADGLTYTWTPPTCFAPSGISVANITTTSADLTWMASSSAPTNGYDVYYSTSNVAPTAATTPNHSGVMGLTQALSGLTPSTAYYVWVRSVCSASDSSSWVAMPVFNTACAAINYMYENFDSTITGSVVPNCWARLAGTGTQSITTTTPVSAPNNLYQNSTTAANQTIVVLPEFSNVNAGTHWLRLRARVGTAPRMIEFGYVTNATDANSFVLIESKNITNTVYTSTDSEYTIIVPNTVPANARLAIKNPGTTSTALYYDDVYWEPIPSCLPPSALMVSNITTSTADLAWTASTTVPANGYDVYYSTTNTAPTAATTPNHSGVMGLTQALTGLTPSSAYFVWVRSKCTASDSSTWVAMQAFNTACTAITDMFENFDTTAIGSVVPNCWDRIVSGAGTQTVSTTSPNSSPNNLYLFSSIAANQTIVVLPVFSNINAGTHWLRLKARVSTGPRTIEFGYVTNVTDANSFVLLETKNMANTTYTAIDSEYTIVVPNTVPANARLAIKNSGSTSTALYLDDVYWEVAPTCFPPSNITATGTSPSTATVSWTASIPVPTNGYEVYYSTSSTAPNATTVPNLTGITGTSTPISGLTPATGYFVWVRSKCSTNDTSNWSALVAGFNTPCQPPAVLSTNVNPTPVCVGGTATISGTTEPGATLNFYDAATDGNLLGTGASYTSPILTSTTNYWVTASTGGTANVGKVTLETNASTGGGLTSYLVFTALSDFTLKTIDLFPYSAAAGTVGTATIELRSDTGASLATATVNVTGTNSVATSVPQTVTVNFPIVGGQSYRLGVSAWTGITNMYRDATNLAFPYSVPGVVNITGGSLATPYYYFFYNWQVSTKCESARTMVTAVYDSTCNLGTTDVEDGRDVKIYPNPFTDVLNISEVKNLVSVSITDMSGRTVKTFQNPTAQIYLGELQSGMYLVNLKYKDGSVKTVKAIKK